MELWSAPICNAKSLSWKTPCQIVMPKSRKRITNFTSKTSDRSTERSLKYPKNNHSRKGWSWKWGRSSSKSSKLTPFAKLFKWTLNIKCLEKPSLPMTSAKRPLTVLDGRSPTISTMRISTWVEFMLKSASSTATSTFRTCNPRTGTYQVLRRTWMRLSKSYDQSSCWLLQHETIFKVGSVSTFICKYQSEEKVRKMSSVEVDCGRCESKKDCFFLPCRHNIMCFECAS